LKSHRNIPVKISSCSNIDNKINIWKCRLNHFDIELVNHYYDILFAAAHPKALEFWNKATEIKYDGQRSLF
jgi:hemoglobin-like flavoprotein